MKEGPDKSAQRRSNVDEILEFWFGAENADNGEPQSPWFIVNPEFDRLCTERFLHRYEEAADGLLDDWRAEPRSCIALVLLLDQFPRNMFRDTARAFATDAKARDVTRHAIAAGIDRAMSPLQRMFLYLPLEHSESLDDQSDSVRLARELDAESPGRANSRKYAEQHFETIKRFGRFPARNAALGRQSTQEELDFLAKKPH